MHTYGETSLAWKIKTAIYVHTEADLHARFYSCTRLFIIILFESITTPTDL